VSAPDQVVLTGQYEGRGVFGATILTYVAEVDAFLAKLDVRGVPLPPPSLGAQFIPNIITPNNDGLNDCFQIRGLPAGPWQLRVYSRWGRLVYQSEDYQQDWSATGLSDGYYLYYLRGPVQPALQGWLDVVH
jgi:gliding motility-associated-like protein